MMIECVQAVWQRVNKSGTEWVRPEYTHQDGIEEDDQHQDG
jgi:hypothetical protein